MHIRQSRLSVILGFAISLATPAVSFAIELQVTPEAVTRLKRLRLEVRWPSSGRPGCMV